MSKNFSLKTRVYFKVLICYSLLIALNVNAGPGSFKKISVDGKQRTAWVQKIIVNDGAVVPESPSSECEISTALQTQVDFGQSILTGMQCTGTGKIDELAGKSNAVHNSTQQSGSQALYLPDLAIYQFSWQNASVTEGQSFWVEAKVCNYGTVNAPASQAAAFLSTDNDFDITDDYLLGKQAVGVIYPSYYESHTWSFTFPDIGSGSYPVWLVVYVDCDNQVLESDEANIWKTNNAFTALDAAGYPDIVLGELTWKGVQVNEGDTFWIKANIQNNGEQAAGASHAALYLSVDNDFDTADDHFCGRVDVPALDPDYYIEKQWDFSFPDLGSGTYAVWALVYVDCDEDVNESDEANLYKTNGSISVSDAQIDLPDLQASTFWYESETVAEGDSFWVAALVNNAGTAQAGASTVCAFLSIDNDFDVADDFNLGKKSVSALAPGLYETIEWEFAFPNLSSGTYPVWIIAVVDFDNKIAELEENNVWKTQGSFNAMDAAIANPDISVNPSRIDLYPQSHRAFQAMPPFYAGPAKTNKDLLYVERPVAARIPQDVKQYWQQHRYLRKPNLTVLAASVDWTLYDSPVKDQGSCGSCWVFAPIALIENIGRKDDLSEQVCLSCVQGDEYFSNSCDGGWMGFTFKYIRDEGVPPEACFPYQADNGNCADKCANPEYLAHVTTCNTNGMWGMADENTVQNLKIELQTGPVCVWMAVPQGDSFFAYNGGIYDYEGDEIPEGSGHFVSVVGYDDTNQCFKAKNSWGNSWGDNGYFYIAYDDVTDDVKFGSYACTADGFYIEGSEQNDNTLIIANTGTSDLHISSIQCDKNWLSFSPRIQTISPQQQAGLMVSVNDWNVISRDGETGTLSILSDDPDESLTTIQVIAHPTGSQVDQETIMPIQLSLSQNYPNPFNPNTTFEYSLPVHQQVEIRIYNMAGQLVEQSTVHAAAGIHQFIWDAAEQPSGIYWLQLHAGSQVLTQKCMLLK